MEKHAFHVWRYGAPLLVLAAGAAALWPFRHQLTAEAIAAFSPRQTVLAASFLVVRHWAAPVSGSPPGLRAGRLALRISEKRAGPLSPTFCCNRIFSSQKVQTFPTESTDFANVFSCEIAHKNTGKGFTANWFHGII